MSPVRKWVGQFESMAQASLFGAALVLVTLGCSGGSALAQTPVAGQPSQVELTIATTIEPRCGWSTSGKPSPTVNLGSLDETGFKDIPFEVDCNTPFTFTASSQGRALAQAAPIEDLPAIFSQEVDYEVNLRLGVRQMNGVARALTATCDASALHIESMCPFAEGSVLLDEFTGDSIATAADTALPRSRLRISWQGQSASMPVRVAGTYSDVLIVSVQAKS
jgi:hypothetical protein